HWVLLRTVVVTAPGTGLRPACNGDGSQSSREMLCEVLGGRAAARSGPAEPSGPGRLLALALLDDLVGDGLGDLGVAVELHRVHGTARGLRAQVADVAEHARQRHEGLDDLDPVRVLHRLHLT